MRQAEKLHPKITLVIDCLWHSALLIFNYQLEEDYMPRKNPMFYLNVCNSGAPENVAKQVQKVVFVE